jgi:KDO2-lipid IV(A) lauroyltransferase
MSLSNRLESLALTLLFALSRLLGPDLSSRLARFFGRRLSGLRRMRHIRRNFSFVLAGQPPEVIEAVARDALGNFTAVIAELPHLERIADPAEGRLEVVLRAPDSMGLQRPAVFVCAHLANWEVMVLPVARLGVPLTIVYTPTPNPAIHRRIIEMRSRFGVEFLPRDRSARQLMRALGAGRSVGIIADGRIDDGEWLPFFRVGARTTTVPARLALRYGADFVPVRMERLGTARFRMTAYEPIRPRVDPADPRAAARDMTKQLLKLFEAWIRERPGEWWCGKRRWPDKAVPRVAKRGAPAAASAEGDPRAA